MSAARKARAKAFTANVLPHPVGCTSNAIAAQLNAAKLRPPTVVGGRMSSRAEPTTRPRSERVRVIQVVRMGPHGNFGSQRAGGPRPTPVGQERPGKTHAAFLIGRFGHMLCNRFLTGRTDTLRCATAALKKIDAAASLLRVARAVAEASVRYFQHKFVHGCVSFLAARIPAAAVSPSHMYAPCFVFP
jgi:hypothetical protein